MKTKISLAILAILLLLSLGSCRHQYPAALVEADSLVYANPKLALEKIDSIASCMDTANVQDTMYLNLIKTFAKDRLFLQINNLSEICRIIEFYEDNQDYSLLAKSYYLRGRVARNLSDNVGALSNFHKALECLEEKDDLKLRSLVNAQIAYVYSAQNNLKLALEFYKEAYRCDSILKDTLGMFYGMRDIAVASDYDGQRSEALAVFTKAKGMMKDIRNEQLKNELLIQLADFYLNENTDSVRKYLMPSLCSKDSISANAAYVAFGYYYLENKDDSAIYYLKHAWDFSKDLNTKYDLSVRLANLYFDAENFSKGQKYYSLSLLYADSLMLEGQHEKEIKGRALYEYVYQTEQVLRLSKSNFRKTIWVLVLFVVLVLILFVFYYYWQLGIVKKLEVQNKLKDWKLKSMKIPNRGDSNRESIINKVGLQKYIETEKHLPDTTWGELEYEVDKAYPSFKKNIYSCYNLTEHEYHICMLAKIGLGTSKIAMLTNRATSTISTTKQRIYKKLTCETGNAEQFDKLLMVF